MATGESATVYGKAEIKVCIANIAVKHVFIVADIIDEAIITTDVMMAQDINLHMS